MHQVPIEVIAKRAFQEVGDYFANKVEQERANGKVAIIVEDFTNSLYYMQCNENGYPINQHFKYMTLDSLSVQSLSVGMAPDSSTITVEETEILIERPMLSYQYDYMEPPQVFLWFGRKMSRKKIPLDKLNVSELMKLAQATIKNREGLVIDEALSNKIYK